MADESIRQLQAELRDVYSSTAKQKLSERNLIEIVYKLIELKLIDVIYTRDGKSYLTTQELEKEIRDELIVHGGRLSLVDLQQILDVDYSHIETKVTYMARHEGALTLVLGQLINNDYRQVLAEDINDILQEKGHVTLVDLTRQHDLPADFIREVINSNLGKRIKGQTDPYEKDILYTSAYVTRTKAQIQGALSAVTVPTAIGPIRQSIGCQEHLFHSILDELTSQSRLSGILSGSRQDKSQFLPRVYSRAQNEWVVSFYRQNGYFEYDALTRLGITDPKEYIRKRFKEENLVFLSSCCVGAVMVGMVDSCVDEALSSGTWCDVSTILPSTLNSKDRLELLTHCLKKKVNSFVCGDSIVGSQQIMTEAMESFKDTVVERAQKSATSSKVSKGEQSKSASGKGGGGGGSTVEDTGAGGGGNTKDDRREQRRKKAAMAGASKKEGTGGREVKMKSTKKKGGGRGREEVDSDGEMDSHGRGGAGGGGCGKDKQAEDQFMTLGELEEALARNDKFSDCPPSMISLIASKIHRPLQKEYQETAKSIFLKLSGTKQKKMAVEVQDRVNGLWTNMRLFEKGLCLFEEPTQGQLTKHLLKTVGSDLATAIVVAIAEDHMVSLPEGEEEALTPESRQKIVHSLPKTSQDALNRLLGSLSASSLEDFYGNVTTLCGPTHLGILLKKPDKKVDRQLVFSHRQQLAEQLRLESDPAMTLHLTSVLLLQTFSQCMLHAPGRLVPAVLQYVASSLDEDKVALLSSMQDLVVKHARYKSDPEVYSEEEVKAVYDQLVGLMVEVKDIGLNTKRNAAAAAATTAGQE